MKKLLELLLALILTLNPLVGYAADAKISADPTKAAPIAADLIPLIDSVTGANQKATLDSLPVPAAVETRLGGATAPSVGRFAGLEAELNGFSTGLTSAATINPGHHHIISEIAGGTADALTATFVPAVATLTNGMTVEITSGANPNLTTTPTFKYGILVAKTIVKGADLPLVAGDIPANYKCIFSYSATTPATDKWVLLNPAKTALANVVGAGGAAALEVGTTAGTVAAGTGNASLYVGTPTGAVQGVGQGNSPTFATGSCTTVITGGLKVSSYQAMYPGVNDTRWGGILYKTETFTSTALSGASYTFSAKIPAGSVLDGITARVNTAISGATSWSIGTVAAPTLWGDSESIELGTTISMADYLDGTAINILYKTAGDVLITANDSDFTGGVIRIAISYHYMTVPTQ